MANTRANKALQDGVKDAAQRRGKGKLRTALKREGASTPEGRLEQKLYNQLTRLKKQWGKDAKDIELRFLDPKADDSLRGNLGYWRPDTNEIVLNMPTIRRAVEGTSPLAKIRMDSLRGRDVKSHASSVLRHELAHAVTGKRLARIGSSDTALKLRDGKERTGWRGYWKIDDVHGKIWNRLNAILSGSGSEIDMPSIRFPSEFNRRFWEATTRG